MVNLNDSGVDAIYKNGAGDPAQLIFALALAQACAQAYAAAIDLLNSLLYQYPDNEWAVEAHVVLGLSYFYGGAYDQAWLTFESMMNAFPNAVYSQGVSQIMEQFDALAANHSLSGGNMKEC